MSAPRTGWTALALLALLGCTDGGGGTSGSTSGGAAASAGSSAGSSSGGTSGGSSTGGGSGTITIAAFTFSPTNLEVPAGATVTVKNMDTAPHSVTSQSIPGTFQPGGVGGVSFDTGVLQPGAQASFTIPASAAAGTVVPYYCTVHAGAMANAAQLTVR